MVSSSRGRFRRGSYLAVVLAAVLSSTASCVKDSSCYPDRGFGVYVDGELCEHFGIGVNSSDSLTNWLADMCGFMKMEYPAGQSWGVVFITYGGDPQPPPRPGLDCSDYTLFSVDLRGETGTESLFVGIKDNLDPDDGSETKLLVEGLSQEWETIQFSLRDFPTADLSSLYVVIEFVFSGRSAKTVYFRDVKYLR